MRSYSPSQSIPQNFELWRVIKWKLKIIEFINGVNSCGSEDSISLFCWASLWKLGRKIDLWVVGRPVGLLASRNAGYPAVSLMLSYVDYSSSRWDKMYRASLKEPSRYSTTLYPCSLHIQLTECWINPRWRAQSQLIRCSFFAFLHNTRIFSWATLDIRS